jgi:hypothetical protein
MKESTFFDVNEQFATTFERSVLVTPTAAATENDLSSMEIRGKHGSRKTKHLSCNTSRSDLELALVSA